MKKITNITEVNSKSRARIRSRNRGKVYTKFMVRTLRWLSYGDLFLDLFCLLAKDHRGSNKRYFALMTFNI